MQHFNVAKASENNPIKGNLNCSVSLAYSLPAYLSKKSNSFKNTGMKKFLYTLALIGLFVSNAFSQSSPLVTFEDITNVGSEFKANVCGTPDTVTLKIVNLSGGNTITGITLDANIASGLRYEIGSVFSTSTPTGTTNTGQASESVVDLFAPKFAITNIVPGQTVYIKFKLQADCAAIVTIQNPIVNNFQLHFGINGSGSFTNPDITAQPYNNGIQITKIPIPDFSVGYGQNLNLANGQTGCRQYRIRNTSITNGSINTFQLYNQHTAGFQLVSLGISKTAGGPLTNVTLTNIGDTTFANINSAVLQAAGYGDSLGQQNDMFVTECVRVITCSNGTYASTVGLRWGTCSGSYCEDVSNTAGVQISVGVPSIASGIDVSSQVNNCFGSQNQTNVFYLTNTGTAPASNVVFNPTITGGSLTTIVNSGVQIDTGTGYFNYTPTFFASPDTALANCVGGTAFSSLRGTLPNILNPGQTVRVRFITKNCCPYVCGRAVFNGWNINGTYTSTCNPSPIAYSAVGASPISVDLAAVFTGGLSYAPNTVYNIPYTVNNVEFIGWDTVNGQWVISVTVPDPAFFTFSNNVADFTWKKGSRSWVPVSATMVGNVITARFNQSPPVGWSFRNSKINVKVTTASCITVPTCTSVIEDYFYFNAAYVPDRTCASPCEIPVECFRNRIRYQKFCGTGLCACAMLDFSFNRVSLGSPDNNDDGLPNGASLITDSILLDRGMYLDTFQANFLTSPITNSSQSMFVTLDIDNANLLGYLGGTISIRDSSAHVTYNCTMPAPTIVGQQYFWKVSASTVSACTPALGGGYTFDSLDVITMNAKWRVTSNVGPFVERFGDVTPGVAFSDSSNIPNNAYSTCGFFDKYRIIGYDNQVWNTPTVSTTCSDTTTIRSNFGFYIYQGRSGENAFPYEYRDWSHATTYSITIPQGYAYNPNSAVITLNRTGGDDIVVTQTANLTSFTKVPTGGGDTTYTFNIDAAFTGTAGAFPYSDDGFDGFIDLKVHALNCNTATSALSAPAYITFGPSPNQHLIQGVASYTGNLALSHSLTHNAPNISMVSAVNPVLGTGKYVSWQFQFSNSGSTEAPNSWFTINASDTSQVKLLSLTDITGAPVVITPNGAGIYTVGSIAASSTKTYVLQAFFTSCNQQYFSVSGGWNCNPYGYPTTPSAYAPCQTVGTTLYVNPVPAKIQTNIITQPATRVDLCDTVTYAVQMGSVDYGRTYSNFVDVFLPLFGIKIIPGTVRLAYPDTNLYVTIPDPALSGISPLGKRYIVNTSLYNSFLDSFGLASGFNPDSASLFVQFKVVTDCGFFSGGRVIMRARAKDGCGSNIQPSLNSTRKLLIKTIGAPPEQSFDVRVTPGNIIPCDSATTITQTIFNTGPYSSDSFAKLVVYLDQGITYSLGSASGLSEPIMDTVGGIIRLTFTVPAGIKVFDSLKVSYRVFAVDSGKNYSFTFRTEVINDIKAICKTTGDTCDLSEITGDFTDTLTVGTPDIRLSNLNTYATCNNPFGEVVHIDYDLTNYNKPTRSGVNIYANLWWDANNNNQLDMVIDQKIATYVIADPIDSGETVHISGAYAVQAFQACGLIIQVDSITSACLPVRIDTALTTIPLLNAGDDVAGCFGDSVSLGCPGSISGYTYNWSAVGAAPIGALSCTSCSNPQYYFPVNNTPSPIVYQYVVSTDRGNCTTNDTVNITVNASPTNVVITSLDTNICFGQSTNLTAVGTPAGGTYQWSPLTFITPATGNTALVTVGPPLTQTYTVKYTNVGCASYASVQVNVVPQVVVSAGVDKSVCVPSAPVRIGGVPTAAGGSGSFSYTWSPTTGLDNPNAANPNATVTSSTTYYVTVTDLVSGCFGVDSMDLTVNPSPSIDAGPNVSICPNSSSQLGASGGISYVWTPTSGLSNPNFCCPIANPSVATWYYVTGTDINGCKAVDSVLVTPIPSFSVSVADTQLCEDDSVKLTPSLLGGQYTYNWTPGTGLSCISCAQPTVETNVNTIYVLTVTDTTTGCSANDTIVVTVRDKPKADFFGEQKCHGDTVQFTDHSQSTDPIAAWSWDFGDSTYAGDGSNLQNPTYVYNSYSAHDASITVTTIYGCKDSFHLPVYSLPPVYPNAGLDTFVGSGSCVVLGGTGGTIFQWSPDSSLSNSNTANPTACPTITTTYTVNITNDFGCSGTDSVTIEVKPLPNVNAGPDTAICYGTSYVMQGSSSTPNVSYTWIPVTFLSNPNIATPVATPTSTMTYVLKVTDQFGIVNYDTMTLTVNSLPVADAGTDKTLFDCAQDSVRLGGTPTANGGSGTYTYSWSPATGVTNTTVANPYVKGISASALYCVTVTDVNGCSASDCVNVTVVPSNLSVSITQTNPTNWCAGSNGSAQFTANVTGGTGPYTYAWSPNSNINAINTQVVTVNPNTAGTYTYTVTVTDAKGCSSVSSASVTVNPLPTNTFTVTGGGAYCAGSGGVVVGLSNSEVGVNYQLLLNNSNLGAPISGTGSAISFGNQTAAGSYTVVATNASTGCVSNMTGSVVVVINPLPIADAGADKTIVACASDSIQIGGSPTASNGTPGYTYSWSPPVGLAITNTANPWVKNISSPTLYTVTVTDNNGCTATDDVLVDVTGNVTSVTISNNGTKTWCEGGSGSVQFTANVTGGVGLYSYSWTPTTFIAPTNAQVVTVNPSAPGTYVYTVVVSDGNGCQASATDSVVVKSLPHPVITGLNAEYCASIVSVPLTASIPGGTFSGPGVVGNTFRPKQIGVGIYNIIYTVTVNGCTHDTFQQVIVNPLPIVTISGNDPDYCSLDYPVTFIGSPAGGTWSGIGVNPTTGEFTPGSVTIPNNISRTVKITYHYSDTNGCTDSTSVNVTVKKSPTLNIAVSADTICVGDAVTLTPSFSAIPQPVNLLWYDVNGTFITNSLNPIVVHPTRVDHAYYATVVNLQNCTVNDTVTIHVNQRPVAFEDTASTCEGFTVSVDVRANDTDPEGNTNNVKVLSVQHGTASVVANNVVYKSNFGYFGMDTFVYQICNTQCPNECDTAQGVVNVCPQNEPPVANPIITTTPRNTPVPVNVGSATSDPNSDPLKYSYPGTPVNGGTVTVTGNGTVIYTPAPGFIGRDSFPYIVCDLSIYPVNVLCDTSYVVVNVTDPADTLVNHAPIANDDLTSTSTTNTVDVNVRANDVDQDGDALTLPQIIGNPTKGTATVNPDGTIKYVPNPSAFPLGISYDTIKYRICDTLAAHNPKPLCDDALVIITVNNVDTTPRNRPPFAGDDYESTPEDQPVVIAVKGNDSDPDGDALTLPQISVQPKNGTVTVNPNGTITYTPTPDYHGVDTFTYIVCDTLAALNPKPLCDTAKVYLVIDPRNEAPIANDIYTTTTEGTPVGVNVSASTTDPNGDPLTFTYPNGTNTGVPGATWTPTGNGTGVYTPAPGYVGTDSFQYVACDTSKYLIHVLCDTAWVYVTVYDTAGFDTINHKPIANNDNAVTTPTQSIDIPVKANDNDPDGNPLTVSIGGGVVAGHGTATPNADGTINYVPNGPFPVGITVDSFSYVVCDVTSIAPQPLCDTAIVYVYINRIDTPEVKKNDPPVATDDYVTTTEDNCVTINVKANDSDPNGDIITTCSSVVTNPKEGTASVNLNGTIEYCPTADFHGQDTFTYCICDDGNPVLCDTAKVIITIDPRNEAPVANDIYTTTTEGTPVGVNVSASTTDPNGDPLTFTYPNGTSTGVPGASWTPTGNGTGVYTPAPGYVGTDSFQYVACDTSKYLIHVLCDTAWVYITVYDTAGFDTINHKPIANNDNAVTTPTQSINVPVKANDNDPDGNPLTVSIGGGVVPSHGSVTPNADGTVTYTPTGTFPLGITVDSFSYVVCDVTTVAPQPLCDTAIVYVYINRIDTPEVKKNDPPVATDDYVTTPEDSCVTINVKANDSDPNGDVITTCSSVVSAPKEGTATVNANGTITYCPTADFHGQDTFTYCICDDGNPVLCDTAKVIITIDPRNEAPVANDIYTTTTEGTPVGVNVSASTTDPNGDPLTFTYPNGTSTGVPGASWTPTGNGTGVYTPAPGYVGTDSFQYVACDTSKYLIHVLCDTAWVYVTVYDTAGFDTINHKPIANNDNAVTTPTQSIDIPVKANDNDPDGNPLTVSIGGGVVPSHGSVTPNADGTVTYTPTGTFPLGITVDSFSYVVCDVTTVAPQPLCDTAIVYVYINRIDTPEVKKNDPPVATDDYVTTPEDSCVTINVKANDSDPNGDVITTCSSVVSAPKEGTATVNANGTITYCPTADFHGQDTFTYCICDDGNPVLCDTAKVIITIDPRNEAPVANDIYTTTTEGTPVGVNVSASTTDPNGDPLTFTYPNGTSTGVPGASWTPTGNGTGVYTPAPGYVGTDSFQYVACDTSKYLIHVLCDTAWVYITVYDTAGFDTINHKPIANNDNAVTTPTQSINVPVKANDNDPDGNPLTVSIGGGVVPSHGSVTPNADGTVTYTPTGTFPLGITVDSFSYVVCDVTTVAPQPLCDTAIVYVYINRIDTPEVKKNDPPVATDDYVTTPEDSCVTINVKANDSDPNGDVITTCSSVVSAPKEGTATVNANGTITYCPTADFHGQDTFTYCICDDGNPVLCDTAKVIITIDPRNEAPVANDIYTTTTEGTPVGVNVSASTTDPNGDPLTFTYPNGTSTGVPGASWTPTGNGTGVYTPAPGYVGTDSFQYVACDTSKYLIHVLCDTAWVYITVYDTAGFDTINHKPIANNDNAVTTPTQSINVPVKANDNDPDGNPLTVSIGGGVVPSHGSVTPNADGTVTYTPTGTFPLGITVDSFSYVVCDVTTVAPQPLCDTAIVYVYINRIDTPEVKKNDPPVATDDYVTLCEEAYTVTPVMDNDGDPNGDLFTIKSITVNPAHGLGSVSGRNIVYVPNTNYYGQDTLSYSICDNGNPVLCDTAKVIYTIYNINDAPIAINDSAVTGAEAPVNIPVLINDIEPDGDSVTIGISSPPVHGTLTQVGNTYTYTPDPGFVGYDTFYYKVCDIKNPNIQYCGGFQSICDVGRVSVHVIYVNRPPVIDPTYVTIPEDTGLVTICPMVSDSDGNNIKITSFICGPSHGTASYVATGSDSCLTYIPEANYYGVDTICVVVCDDGILPLCDTNKVYINIIPVCDAPIAVNDYYTVTSVIPSTSNIVVVVNDTSVENSGLTVGIVTQPTTGIVSANANNTITYIPNGANGMDSFQYSICNVGPLCTLCDTAWVVLNVRPNNNPPIAVNDTASTPEDSAVCVSVMNNDSDPDSDPITLQNLIPCGPSNGTAVVNAGQLCYTPNHNFIGQDSICYVICDNGVPALCDTGVLVVTVTPRPDPPIAVNDTVTTTEGTQICIAVMSNDTTPDGLPITITAIPCAPATGTAVNGGNIVCYTPSATYTSLDSFCYVICDNRMPALCDTAKVYVFITPNQNHPPVAVDDSTTTPESTPVVICVPTNDLDPDFNLNLASVGVAIQPANGTILGVDPSTGCITYLPDSGFRGLDTFVYTICDTGAPVYCDQATVFVTVTFVNHPPVALDSTVTTPEDSAITVCPSFSDPDGDVVTITAIPCGPSHGSVTNTGSCITYTPAPNYNGTDSICYVVCDNGSPSLCDTAVIRIIVTPVVDCPIANIDYAQGTNGVAVVINELTNDTYLHTFGSGSTVTIVSGPASGNTAVVNANGTISYTAGASYNGIDSVVYSLCDTVEGCCDTATIYVYTIDYCVPPIALNDNDTVCEEAVLKSYVRANDFQGFGQIGNVTILTNATHGFAFVNSADTTIMYTPQTNFFGNDTVTYQVCSQCVVGAGPLCDTAQLFITVLNRNDVPVAIDDTASVLEDSSVVIDVVANDYDIDGDSLVVSISAQPAFGTLTVVGNQLRYTPNANYCGPDSFGYRITGGNGASTCPGDEAFDLGLVFLNVICVNDPPVIPDTLVHTPEDSSVTVCVPFTDNDPNDLHALTICGLPLHGTANPVLDNVANTVCLTYVPDTNFYGIDSICVIVCDNGTPQLCDTSHIIIVVDPRNEPPVANDQNVQTPKNTPIGINVASSASDPNGDYLTFTYPAGTGPNHGTWVPTGNGTGVYTPDSGYVGKDTFMYVACDTSIYPYSPLCDTAYIYIDVIDTTGSVNHPPLANDDYYTTHEGVPVLTLPLANDYDVDGDPLTITVTSGPSNGTIVQNPNGTITYTPDSGFVGNDTVHYTICDNGTPPLCDSAIIVITITPDTTALPNNPPVATDDFSNTNYGTPVVIGVMGNDYDPDGDSIYVTSIIDSTNFGTVTVNPDGTVTYVPFVGPGLGPNANKPDTFVYVICDNGNPALCDTATVIISVPNSVQATNDTSLTGVNSTVVINVKANDWDPELDSFYVVEVLGNGGNGTTNVPTLYGNATINPDGTITYVPNGSQCDVMDTFRYTVRDTLGAVDTATVFVFVDCCSKPIAVDDNVTMDQGDTLTSFVIANDVYKATYPQHVVISVAPVHGTATVINDTTVVYIPFADYCGTDYLEYILSDTCGVDTANLNITVECKCLAPVAVNDFGYTTQNTLVYVDVVNNDTMFNTTNPYYVSVVFGPNHGTASAVGDSVAYTPTAGFYGNDTLTYNLCIVCKGDTFCSSAVVIIKVDSVCQAPIAVADTIESGSVCAAPAKAILINDTNTLGAVVTIVQGPVYGTITLSAAGDSITYTPDGVHSNVTDVILYSITNVCGKSDTGAVYVKVSNYPCNFHHPLAMTDTAKLCLSTGTTLTVDVLANDFDQDNDSIRITFVSSPSHGTATVVAGEVVYTYTTPGFVGKDTFAYSVCDNGTPNLCRDATVIITIDSCNNNHPVIVPPITRDTTPENTPVVICVTATDPDVDSTYISSICTPAHGTISDINGMCFTYTPDSNWIGDDTFCIVICDNGVPTACDTGLVIVHVYPIDTTQFVLANNDVEHTPGNTPVVINVLVNDTFGPFPGNVLTGDSIFVSSVDKPVHGSAVIDSNGNVIYTPDNGYCGVDSFHYVLSDNGKPVQFDTATVIIYVCDTPTIIAVDDTITTDKNTPVVVNVLGNDTIPSNNGVTVNVYTYPTQGGTVNVNTDGSITYVPKQDYFGKDTFSYIVCANIGNGTTICDTATVIVSIPGRPTCFFPNAFSPNGDGIDETFQLPCNAEYPNSVLKVYNRWGDEVWRNETAGYKNDWDGKNLSKTDLPDGTYYYVYQYNDGSGNAEAKFVVIQR
jgi:gliding motility-associated-like protein